LLQFPFWGLVFFYRLSLVQPATKEQPTGPTQFGIRQFMIFTAIVSVLLGIGRIVVSSLPLLGDVGGDWPIFIFLAFAAMVMTLPLVLAALLPRMALPAVLVVLLLMILATFVELPLLKHIGPRGGGPDVFHFVSINAFTALWILLIAMLVRWAGFRLGSRRASYS
jgi:hypothetical protein